MSEYIRTNKFDTNECPTIFVKEQARKPRSYASPKSETMTHPLNHLLTGVKCRATSVAKKRDYLAIFYQKGHPLKLLHQAINF